MQSIPLPPTSSLHFTPQLAPPPTQQPHTTPIAHFTSTPPPNTSGSLIDVSHSYIVYAVKNGLIRVIERHKALRTLLRGHTVRVTDIQFFGRRGNSDVLGTVGGAGNLSNVLIWRLVNREDEVGSEKLLEMRLGREAVRLEWHPFNPNQFLMVHGDSTTGGEEVRASLVETTRLQTTSDETEGHAVCDGEGDVKQLCGESAVNDVCWGGDGDRILTAEENGMVRLWEVGVVLVLGVVEKAHEGKAVCRCVFLEGYASGAERREGEWQTAPFVTTADENREVCLWSPFTNRSSPSKIRTFRFLDEALRLNFTYCTTGLDTATPSTHLLFADRERGNLYALHLSTRDDAISGFDYLTLFQVVHPILSWSVITSTAVTPPTAVITDNIHHETNEILLFCVQSKAVQLLKLKSNMFPSSEVVTVPEQLHPSVAIAAIPEYGQHNFEEEEDYEMDADYSSQNENYDYESSEEEEEEHLPSPPPAACLPPPGLEHTKPSFANWLGSIASSKVAPVSAPTPPNSRSASVTGVSKATGEKVMPVEKEKKQDSFFLSPMEFLNQKKGVVEKKEEKKKKKQEEDIGQQDEEVEKMETKPQQQPPPPSTQPPPTTKPKKKSTSPPPSKSKKTKKPQQQPQPPPPPSSQQQPPPSPAKIILKRPPPTELASPPPPSLQSETHMEEIIRRALKKHEMAIFDELQKILRQEVIPEMKRANQPGVWDEKVGKMVMKCWKEEKVGESLKEEMREVFCKTMREILIPAFESATQQMFTQIATTLQTSLAESSQQTTTQHQHDTHLLQSLHQKIDTLTQSLTTLSTEVTQLRTAATAAATQPPYPPPPSPTKQDKLQQTRDDILIHLTQHDYETAFTTALSASSADIAVFACKHADVSSVLDGDSPTLSQPILLCLMQQLGSILSSSEGEDLTTILEWLQDIAVTLNPREESIRRHVGEVMRMLVENVEKKMREGGVDSRLRRQLQMLLQVIRGMGGV